MPKQPNEYNGKQADKAEVLKREIKKLVRTPHGHFTVLSNSDRVLAITVSGHLFVWGTIPFRLTSERLKGGGFKVYVKE